MRFAITADNLTVNNDGNLHTMLTLVTFAAQVRLLRAHVGFGSKTLGDEPVEWLLGIQATFGSGASVVTPVNTDAYTIAPISVARRGLYSTEPTYSTVFHRAGCPPYHADRRVWPLGKELIVPANSRVGLAVINYGVNSTFLGTFTMEFEE